MYISFVMNHKIFIPYQDTFPVSRLIQSNHRNDFSHTLWRIRLETLIFPSLRKSSRDMRRSEEGCNAVDSDSEVPGCRLRCTKKTQRAMLRGNVSCDTCPAE